jgi:hypothetical protein
MMAAKKKGIEVTVQAKVRCIGNSPPQWDSAGTTMIARFTPVYDADPDSPNFEWSQATPSGYIELAITNAAAFGAFEPGQEYLLTFELGNLLHTSQDRARDGYERYREHAGGVSKFSGDVLPSFDDQDEDVRAHWIAAFTE